MPHIAQTCPLGSVSNSERVCYRQSCLCNQHVSISVLLLPSGHSAQLLVSTTVSFSPNQREFITFFHSFFHSRHSFLLPLSLALFPAPSPCLQVLTLSWSVIPARCSFTLDSASSSPKLGGYQERKGSTAAPPLHQGLPLAAECSNPPCKQKP